MRHDFWNTIRRLGDTGAARMTWRKTARDDYGLLEPFLEVLPDCDAIFTKCRHCEETRFISHPEENKWIIEPRDWCGYCEPEIVESFSDIETLHLNRHKIASAIAGPLRFIAGNQYDKNSFSRLIMIGICQRGAVSASVDLLLPTSIRQDHFDALIPRESKGQRIILHLGLNVERLLQLRERNVIAMDLTAMLEPIAGGAFKPHLSISEMLARAGLKHAGINETDDAISLRELRDAVREVPSRTASLISGATKKRFRVKNKISEPGFEATMKFQNINWQGRKYRIQKTAARIIEQLYFADRVRKLPGMQKDELFSEVFDSSDKRKWSSMDTRVQYFFRTGDAKRLWDDGLIGHNNKGVYFLKLPELEEDTD